MTAEEPVLAGLRWGRLRPGLELFAKKVSGESTVVQLGPGVIIDAGRFDVPQPEMRYF